MIPTQFKNEQHGVTNVIKYFNCPLCVYSTSRKADMKKHVQTHTGEKSFSCSYCNKQFIQKNNLKRHLLIHMKKKHYSSNISCGERNFN